MALRHPMNAILALDQGTTSSRAIILSPDGSILGRGQVELPQHYPQPGWVEHDPADLWETQWRAARLALDDAGLRGTDLSAVGIVNQRETTLLWERSSGRPLHRAIVWQDRRTAPQCQALLDAGHEAEVIRRTGLVLDPYFSATKLRWLLDHVPDARRRAEAGELAFGTVDSWIVWQLTGGREHVTDPTNASRTLLFNLGTGDWDDALLELFGIPRALLPRIVPSSGVAASTHPSLFGVSIPIAGIAGDQQSALFGQNCLEQGQAKNTYGTGCFLLMNIGDQPTLSRNRLLTTVACPTGRMPRFALEGSVFVGGAVVQWLRDGLGFVRTAGEVEALAASVPDTGGVCLVPAFAGLGAPHWDPLARGSLLGLTRGTTAAHIARAALEGIAFQVADVLEAMCKDSGFALGELRVDGGASTNNLLMQFQADLLQVPVLRPRITETTALGAAFLAGLGAGVWPDPADIRRIWQLERTFIPRISAGEACTHRERWQDALRRTRHDAGGT
jgi:glycerol kinase